MSKRKKKRRFFSWYYCILLIVIAAFVFSLNKGLQYIWMLLQEYEDSQPKYAAETVTEMFERRDYAAMHEKDTIVPELGEEGTLEAYTEQLRARMEGRMVSVQETYSASDDEKNYTVLLDGEKFATYNLVRTVEDAEPADTRWALPKPQNVRWTLDSITTTGWTMDTYTVTAPASFTVYANGKPLDESNVIEKDIKTASAGWLPQDVPSPTLVRYQVSSCLGEPEITAEDAKKNVLQPDAHEANDFTFVLPQDEELKAKIKKNVVTIAKQIAMYTTGDASAKSVYQYIYNNTPAHRVIENTDTKWCLSHDSYSFKKMSVDDCYSYSDKCFSCTVSFNYLIKFNSKTTKTYPTQYTMYFYVKNGTCKMYNFKIN